MVYGAFDIIKEKTEKEPHGRSTPRLWRTSCPPLEVGPPCGRRTYQVPIEVRPEAVRPWSAAGPPMPARGEKTMKERLAGEIMDARQQTSAPL